MNFIHRKSIQLVYFNVNKIFVYFENISNKVRVSPLSSGIGKPGKADDVSCDGHFVSEIL